MATLTSTLGIAIGSMQTAQTALSTVSHNISNVNSSGFVRQEVQTESRSIEGFGAGVEIGEIRRVVDKILVRRMTDQKSSVGYAQNVSNYMDNLEVIFGTPGAESSMEKVMNRLFNEMNTLANNPESSSLQLNVVKTAEFVVDTIKAINSELTTAASRIDSIIDDEIGTINEAVKNIKDLNDEIIRLGAGNLSGANANDLIDERQRQLDIVAERLKINLATDELGRFRVSTETGRRLADTGYVQLERIAPAPGSSYQDIGSRPVGSDGTPGSIVFPILTSQMTTGGLKGMIDVRDTEIPGIVAELDELANALITEINSLHSQGTAIQPAATLTTGNGHKLSGVAADLFDPAEMNMTAGTSFNLSIVDQTTGQPISTTLAAGGGAGAITLPGVGPFTLTDMAALINGNADVGGAVTASVVLDTDGNPQLQVSANNAGEAIVFANETGNPMGEIGINNFFTGTDSATIGIRSDIVADPSRIATARMRASDGGVSFQDSRNITELAKMADVKVAFNAAGGLASQSETLTGYFINISTNLAVNLQDNSDREDFANVLLNDMEQRNSSISGVNMDEELTNLLLFQNTFQASSRIVATVDEMMQTLINIV